MNTSFFVNIADALHSTVHWNQVQKAQRKNKSTLQKAVLARQLEKGNPMPKPLPDIIACPWIKGAPVLIGKDCLGFFCEQYTREWTLAGPYRLTRRGAINAWNRVMKKYQAKEWPVKLDNIKCSRCTDTGWASKWTPDLKEHKLIRCPNGCPELIINCNQ